MKKFYCFILFSLFLFLNNSHAQWSLIYKGLLGDFPPDDPFIDFIYNITSDLSNPSHLYLSYNGYVYRIYQSTDYGDNWSLLAKFNNQIGFNTFIVNDNKIWVNDTFYSYDFSDDYGITWKNIVPKINSNPMNYLLCCVYNNNKIYIGTGNYGPYKSSDWGNTWNSLIPSPDDINLTPQQKKLYKDLVIAPINSFLFVDSSIYISSLFGVAYSRDNGKSFQYVNGLSSDNYSLYKIAKNLLAIDENDRSLHLSTDEGTSWELIYPKDTISVGRIQICGHRVYFTLYGSNYPDSCLYYTDDYFKNIQKITFSSFAMGFNKKLFSGNLYILGDYIFYSICDKDYASNIGCLLFRAKLKDCEIDTTSTEVEEIPPPVPLGLSISPNPASDFIEIKGLAENKNWEIFNVLGIRLCGSEDNLTPSPSPKEERGVRVDVSAFPPGVYFLRAGGKVIKFIKIL